MSRDLRFSHGILGGPFPQEELECIQRMWRFDLGYPGLNGYQSNNEYIL
jgi:hypothetical protein